MKKNSKCPEGCLGVCSCERHWWRSPVTEATYNCLSCNLLGCEYCEIHIQQNKKKGKKSPSKK